MSSSDQTVYIYRVETTNTPVKSDWEEDQSPMVIRLSAEAIQIEHGSERFSQNMTDPPWQATTQKDGKKNRKKQGSQAKTQTPTECGTNQRAGSIKLYRHLGTSHHREVHSRIQRRSTEKPGHTEATSKRQPPVSRRHAKVPR